MVKKIKTTVIAIASTILLLLPLTGTALAQEPVNSPAHPGNGYGPGYNPGYHPGNGYDPGYGPGPGYHPGNGYGPGYGPGYLLGVGFLIGEIVSSHAAEGFLFG
jgi:hypothetical protein